MLIPAPPEGTPEVLQFLLNELNQCASVIYDVDTYGTNFDFMKSKGKENDGVSSGGQKSSSSGWQSSREKRKKGFSSFEKTSGKESGENVVDMYRDVRAELHTIAEQLTHENLQSVKYRLQLLEFLHALHKVAQDYEKLQ